TIGSGVKEISGNAFDYCRSLLSITIPAGVQTIGANAFLDCRRLREVYNLSSVTIASPDDVDSSVTVHTDASEESVIHNTDDGFSFITKTSGTSLIDYWGDGESVVLPDDYAGEGYRVADYALAYNARLKSVKFSAGVKNIGYKILYKSDNVTSLTVDSGNVDYCSAGNCVIKTAAKLFVLGCQASVIPDDGSVTAIGSNVFCDNATIVNAAFKIPDSVTSVASNAFYGCNGIMRTVGLVKYVDKWAIGLVYRSGEEKLDLQFEQGTVGIAASFRYTSNTSNRLQSVTFNDELRYVNGSAFKECENLTTVNFNDGLVSIGAYAFEDCKKLQELVIPNTVSEIGWWAFGGCSALTYAKLPDGLNV
ncbi:MAG: leucine-rich repeat domain-containing protein, partial [Clostridiales bacterium]|nr:leucine-rich repeat domain-containing protein [Clostridiales bacterium]